MPLPKFLTDLFATPPVSKSNDEESKERQESIEVKRVSQEGNNEPTWLGALTHYFRAEPEKQSGAQALINPRAAGKFDPVEVFVLEDFHSVKIDQASLSILEQVLNSEFSGHQYNRGTAKDFFRGNYLIRRDGVLVLDSVIKDGLLKQARSEGRALEVVASDFIASACIGLTKEQVDKLSCILNQASLALILYSHKSYFCQEAELGATSELNKIESVVQDTQEGLTKNKALGSESSFSDLEEDFSPNMPDLSSTILYGGLVDKTYEADIMVPEGGAPRLKLSIFSQLNPSFGTVDLLEILTEEINSPLQAYKFYLSMDVSPDGHVSIDRLDFWLGTLSIKDR